MGDILKPVGQWISGNIPLSIGIGLFIISLLFEISKVKIYPLRWLWKLISWPFKKIDEQRTASFKNIVISLQADIETKLSNLTATFDDKLNSMASSQESNCATVKSCFTDLEKRFDGLEAQLKTLDTKQNDSELKLDLLASARIKNHVLNFARQCRKGEPHSHEDFANLFKENEQYEELVKKYKWKNDVYTRDYAYILRVYDECNNRGDFLE